MTGEITTVADLIAALTAYPADAAVRLAVAPGYPQAAAVGPLACSPDDADLTGRERPRPDEPGGDPQCGSPKARSWDTSPRSPATPSTPGHADPTRVTQRCRSRRSSREPRKRFGRLRTRRPGPSCGRLAPEVSGNRAGAPGPVC